MNKLTNEELCQCGLAIIAASEGKMWQYRTESGQWFDATDEDILDIGRFPMRPKPELATRPWIKPEDVPGPVCWIRERKWPNEQSMILGVSRDGVDYISSNNNEVETDTWTELRDFNCEYSTDRKTWFKCEVTT